MRKLRVVLDTDMGSDVDDALCLTLALAAPEIEMVAVTTVTKDTVLRAQISKRLLELAGRADIPVYAGCREPLAGEDRFVWFGHEGQGILESGARPEIEKENAVDVLLRIFRERAGTELVTVGPLTNVAAALQRDPGLAARIPRITMMGGYVRARGLEYNLCADPEASMVVFRSGIPIRLVPCDVTLKVWLRECDLVAIERAGSELHRALACAVRIWAPVMRVLYDTRTVALAADNVAFLHDPLALACAYDESFCGFEDLLLEPGIVGGAFELHERQQASASTVSVRCATTVDAARFRAHFLERMTSGNLPCTVLRRRERLRARRGRRPARGATPHE